MKSPRFLLAVVFTWTLALGGASVLNATPPPPRVWTDTQGRQVVAYYVMREGDEVVLQTSRGLPYRIPISHLSAEDQEALKTLKPAETVAEELAELPEYASVAQAAARIDDLVQLGLQIGNAKGVEAVAKKTEAALKAGKPAPAAFTPLKPNPICTDSQFVRRIYLDIAGRIPTYEETLSFLQSGDAQKRTKLIDALLVSDGYVSSSFDYFADMLRIRDNFEGTQVRAHNYIAWLKEQLRNNTPWDKMVREMLTAKGKVWNNGAAGYLLRDAGMPLDNLANTLSVFLSTDLACAQCHDHPFAKWTQKQFYEMAAFFGATTTRLSERDFPGGDPAKRVVAEFEETMKRQGMETAKFMGQVNNILNENRVFVHDLGEDRTKLPMDYRYKDGKPNEKVVPHLIAWTDEDAHTRPYIDVEEVVNTGDVTHYRTSFAQWMTDPDNPRFSLSIANRLWARVFGLPLTASIRSIDSPEDSFNPSLLKHLGKEMVRQHFNMKAFLRVLYNTKTYQRETTTSVVPRGEAYYFQGPVMRRMTAEQAWDSYLTLLLGDEVDAYQNTQADDYGHAIDLDVTKTTVQSLASKLTALQNLGRLQQQRVGGGLKNGGKMVMDDKILTFGQMKLMRASELEQPAPMGHFLREFGQSSRISVDGSELTGSSPQVLMMMNGPAQKMLTDKQSLIHRTLKSIKDPADKTEAIFLSILNRRCTLREKDIAKKELMAHGDDGYSNMIWALVNSLEFYFVQ